MKSKNGFSLVELLVVFVIIGILAGIVGISAKTWLDRYRVEAQMKEMYVDLLNARGSSMQKSRAHFVKLTSTQYSIYSDTSPTILDGDGAFQTDDTRVVQKNINPMYQLTFDDGEIDFNSKGLASIETTIRVNGSFGSAYDCIVITFTRIRMGAWNGTSCAVQ